MNKVEIPTKFELARCKHTVNIVDYTDRESFGWASNCSLEINIARESRRDTITKDKQLNSFYHELVHSIMFALDRNDLGNDEVLVTAIGNLLMEFDLTRDNVPVKVIEAPMCFVDGEDKD